MTRALFWYHIPLGKRTARIWAEAIWATEENIIKKENDQNKTKHPRTLYEAGAYSRVF